MLSSSTHVIYGLWPHCKLVARRRAAISLRIQGLFGVCISAELEGIYHNPNTLITNCNSKTDWRNKPVIHFSIRKRDDILNWRAAFECWILMVSYCHIQKPQNFHQTQLNNRCIQFQYISTKAGHLCSMQNVLGNGNLQSGGSPAPALALLYARQNEDAM